MRKVEYDSLQITVKANTVKLKEILGTGETNDKIAEKLAAMKL